MKKRKNIITTIIVIVIMVVLTSGVFTACGKVKNEDGAKDFSLNSNKLEIFAESRAYMTMIGTMETNENTLQQFNTEEYEYNVENRYMDAMQSPVSTFSIDVDTASYSNIRRFLNDSKLPPADAVRIEEMVNYFSYEYSQTDGDVPFSITTELSECSWNKEHYLAMISLQGKIIKTENIPPSNLVFLIDVSGSMAQPNKLPLLKSAFKLLTEQLREEDRISMVVYAGAAGTIIEGVSGGNNSEIMDALEKLRAGGSTAGGQGIELAYEVAKDNYLEGGNNRVILATDGDFNIGTSSTGELIRLIEKKRKDGIFLSVLGFGTGNYKDSRMESLADTGNGNYAYIDSIMEAKKVLINEFGGTMFTIAKDVKIQIEFNASKVKEYRLIGYENRILNREDFNDDTKDAGELGSGHTVTAFYELVPAGSNESNSNVDDLKYQNIEVKDSDEWMTVKLRYKHPEESMSNLLSLAVGDEFVTDNPSDNFSFASAVAEFGLLLKDSQYKSDASYQHVIKSAKKSKGDDNEGYRSEFIRLVEIARYL